MPAIIRYSLDFGFKRKMNIIPLHDKVLYAYLMITKYIYMEEFQLTEIRIFGASLLSQTITMNGSKFQMEISIWSQDMDVLDAYATITYIFSEGLVNISGQSEPAKYLGICGSTILLANHGVMFQ